MSQQTYTRGGISGHDYAQLFKLPADLDARLRGLSDYALDLIANNCKVCGENIQHGMRYRVTNWGMVTEAAFNTVRKAVINEQDRRAWL
jgi:hypothetical protein